jgi:RNA-directed DNA polymerase
LESSYGNGLHRLHPNKGSHWIGEDTSTSTETRKLDIHGAYQEQGRKTASMVKLVKASDTKIERHIKIRGEANPFDPLRKLTLKAD